MNANKQQAVVAVEQAIGVDLRNPGARIEAAMMAREKFSKSKAPRIIQSGELDWAALGAGAAEAIIATAEEANAALNEIKKQWRVTAAVIWHSVAMDLPNASDPAAALKTAVEGFKAKMESKGHKRAAEDTSEFKLYCQAYLVSPTETMGVIDELPLAEAKKELRVIRDTGKRSKTRTPAGKRKPTAQAMKKIIEQVSAMDTAQLTAIFKAGQSRAKVLRKKGEIFEAFR